MSAELMLKVPSLKETGERARWLSDPKTMSYNAFLYDDMEGYDRSTGCIEFPMSSWRWWRGAWLGLEPERFAAFIRREDGVFVGEVSYWYDSDADMHSAGVLVMHRYRHRGYGTRALSLLTEHALARPEIRSLFTELPITREDAVGMYLSCGYREYSTRDGILRLIRDR